MTTPARQLYDLINSALTEDPCEFPLKFAYRLAQQAMEENDLMRELLFEECHMKIEDAVNVLEHGFEYDDESWEADISNAVETLYKVGFDGLAIMEEIQDELSEDE